MLRICPCPQLILRLVLGTSLTVTSCCLGLGAAVLPVYLSYPRPQPQMPTLWGICSLPAYRAPHRVHRHPPHARNSSGTGDPRTEPVTASALVELTFYLEEQTVYTATSKTCSRLGDDKGQWGKGIRSHSTRRDSNFKWVIREGFTKQLEKLGNASRTVS